MYRSAVDLPEYGLAKDDPLRVVRVLPGSPARTLKLIVLWARQFHQEERPNGPDVSGNL